MKTRDMLSTGVGVLLVSKVEMSGEERERRLRFLDTGKRRHVSNSDLPRQQVWSNGSDVL